MYDTLSETTACDLIARLFRNRGYAISRNIMFREYGVVFHIDGWDAKARVGFEFLTSEDDDHDDLSLEEYKTLMMAQQRGELSLFVIDEVEPLSEADLTATVNEFLDEVAAARQSRGGRPRPARATGKRKATTAAASTKKQAKPAAHKAAAAKATKRPAAKKPVAKKKPTLKKAAKKTAPKKPRRAST
jgi:hypothetical protein